MAVSRATHLRVLRRLRPPFLAHDVAFTPSGEHVWISSGNLRELAIYDAQKAQLLTRVDADWPPQHITFAGGRAFVASGWAGTVYRHREDGHQLARTVVPVGSYNVQESLGWVVTPSLDRGYLSILDDNGMLHRSERIARSSHDACIVRPA